MAVLELKTLEDYKPQGIPVMIDPTADRILKSFHCPVCGDIVFQYYGGIKLIMHGDYNEKTKKTEPDDEVDWFKTLGVPYPIKCAGRLPVEINGAFQRIRCKTTIYKVGT